MMTWYMALWRASRIMRGFLKVYQFFEFRLVPEHFSKHVYRHLVTYAASSRHDEFDHIHEVIDMFVFPLG